MYTRSNSYVEAPGRWISGDGEYEFSKMGESWSARRRDSNVIIGCGRTLSSVMALAGRHYVTPVGQWPTEESI